MQSRKYLEPESLMTKINESLLEVLSFSAISSEANLRVGLFGVGLEAYWPQFPELKRRLDGYMSQVAIRLSRPGVEITDLGIIDTPNRALKASHELRRANVDVVFLYVTTYALSATVLPLMRRLKVPLIVLNLQPTSRIDYASFNRLPDRQTMTGEWLAYCSACPLPEFVNVFRRSGIEMHEVTGVLEGEDACWKEIDDWISAAQVVADLEQNRLGLLGHYYSGMLDIYTDLTLLSAVFGVHTEILEVEELASLRGGVEEEAIDGRVELFERAFEMQDGCDPTDIAEAARTSIALDRLVERHGLKSVAYYHKGTGNIENEQAISSIILGTSLLTAQGIPVAGEYEVKNVLAMKILASLGAGGSFSEFYATDFEDDVVLMGHDGPGHIAIAEGRPKVRSLALYHGKVGRGLSIEMSVRHGPVTLLSLAEDPGRGFKLVVAEGESVLGPTLEIGNTNSRYRFSIGARRFLSEWSAAGPAHHCAIGVGHLASTIEKVGALLRIPVIHVC
jgi:L-arabinose isomerase